MQLAVKVAVLDSEFVVAVEEEDGVGNAAGVVLGTWGVAGTWEGEREAVLELLHLAWKMDPAGHGCKLVECLDCPRVAGFPSACCQNQFPEKIG